MKLIKYITLYFIGLSFILVLGSCEESGEWDGTASNESIAEPVLVVDGILSNQLAFQEIRLSTSFVELNGIAPGIGDALVKVEANGFVYDFANDPAVEGLYKSQIEFKALPDLNYQLSVQWNDQVYNASSSLAFVSPIPEISFRTYANTDSLVLIDNIPIYNPSQESMYEIEIDWSHLTTVEPNQAKLFFYTFNAAHINGLIRPERMPVPFPKGSFVVVKKYGLSEGFADFLQGKVIETDWSGAWLYSTAENLSGNVDNDALGYFSVCSVLVDSLEAE